MGYFHHGTPYERVRRQIAHGDLLLFRNPRSLIAEAGRGVYSHAAMAVWYGRPASSWKTLLLVESREWHGGRIVTLKSQVERYPGRIDVFRPKCPPHVNDLAAEFAIRQAGHPYNYRGIVACGLLHLPLVRRGVWLASRYWADTSDLTLSAWDEPKFCSQLDVWCRRKAAISRGATWDPVPGLGDRWCEPNDEAHSGAFDLMFEQLYVEPPSPVVPLELNTV